MTLYAPKIWGSVKPLKDSFEDLKNFYKLLFLFVFKEFCPFASQIVQKKMTILINFLPILIPNHPSKKKGWRLANPMFFFRM